jgi:hypothetical protein
MEVRIALFIYLLFIGITIAFQLALALGAPWGKAAMGGKYPGRYPPSMRIAAVVQALILGFIGMLGWIAAGNEMYGLYSFSRTAIWIVVPLFAVGTYLHIITKSKIEQRLWLPVNIILLVTSSLIAIYGA